MEADKKLCGRCKQLKDVTAFSKDKNRKDGRQTWCKECTSAYCRNRKTELRTFDDGGSEPRKAMGRRKSQIPSLQELKELAIATRNMARRLGAYVDEASGHHGYFTVDEWCQILQLPRSIWPHVQRMIFKLGEPLAVDDFGGYFWGKQGNQAKVPAALVKRAMTMLETAYMQIEAMQESPQWMNVQPNLREQMEKGRRIIGPREMVNVLRGAGLPVTPGFEQLLLTTNTNQVA